MTAFIVGTSNTTSSRISIAAFLPPAIALAVLLQLGGAGRFAQATGAICSVITAFCIIILWKKLKPENLSKLPVALLALFAWSGWLFAELRWGLALLLFTAPLASYAVSFLPVKKIPPMLRDALASAAIAIPIAAIALSDYLADSADSEGY